MLMGKFDGLCSGCDKTNDRFPQRYCKICHAAFMRVWRKTHPLSEEQRMKDRARSYANIYAKRGKLIKTPCVNCGEIDTEKHHPDYSKPLDVIWVCRKCHLELHKKGRFIITDDTLGQMQPMETAREEAA